MNRKNAELELVSMAILRELKTQETFVVGCSAGKTQELDERDSKEISMRLDLMLEILQNLHEGTYPIGIS
jgi:hypothetical protein